MSERQEILDGLKPLFEKARQKKQLFCLEDMVIFRCNSINIFTADELEERQKMGDFVLNASHWKLVNPKEIKKELKEDIDRAKKKYKALLNSLKAAGY
jgi:hypothetical protein